jgi:hypothetical protein
MGLVSRMCSKLPSELIVVAQGHWQPPRNSRVDGLADTGRAA